MLRLKSLLAVLISAESLTSGLAVSLHSVPLCKGPASQTVLLRLYGGHVSSNVNEMEAGLLGRHSQDVQELTQEHGYSGEVFLSEEPHTLAHIVEHAAGPLRIKCRWQGVYSWDDAAGISSSFPVDIVGGPAPPGSTVDEQGRGSENMPVLAGQWLLMEDSHGSFKNVSLVYRCPVDRNRVETRMDMMVCLFLLFGILPP